MLHKQCGILEPSKIQGKAPSFLPILSLNKKFCLYFGLCYYYNTDNFCVDMGEKRVTVASFTVIIQHPIVTISK